MTISKSQRRISTINVACDPDCSLGVWEPVHWEVHEDGTQGYVVVEPEKAWRIRCKRCAHTLRYNQRHWRIHHDLAHMQDKHSREVNREFILDDLAKAQDGKITDMEDFTGYWCYAKDRQEIRRELRGLAKEGRVELLFIARHLVGAKLKGPAA